MKKIVTIERCRCGNERCEYWWLVGIGSFVQGSGFTKKEAEKIARLLNKELNPHPGD